MSKISLDMNAINGPSVRVTAIAAVKDFLYKYSKTGDKSTHVVRHIKIDGMYYSVSVSFKDDVVRVKLFEQGNRCRIGYIGQDKKDGRYEELVDAYNLLAENLPHIKRTE